MKEYKTLKQHCQESPTFAEKLKRVVMGADFMPHMWPRVDGYKARSKGSWLDKAKEISDE